ncbi:MAG: hypothetical protein ACSLE9_21080 [Burkholderiaceae bacterium]
MWDLIKLIFFGFLFFAMMKAWFFPGTPPEVAAPTTATRPSATAPAPEAFAQPVPANAGREWRNATSASRHAEVSRILANMASRGCRIKLSTDYYVRQLNDLYATSATDSLTISQALALVATGAGERWEC